MTKEQLQRENLYRYIFPLTVYISFSIRIYYFRVDKNLLANSDVLKKKKNKAT